MVKKKRKILLKNGWKTQILEQMKHWIFIHKEKQKNIYIIHLKDLMEWKHQIIKKILKFLYISTFQK